MDKRKKFRYLAIAGFVLVCIGVGMLTIPAVQSLGDLAVDGNPPYPAYTYPAPSSTKDDPVVLASEYPVGHAFFSLSIRDDTSGADMSTFHVRSVNVSKDRVLFDKTGARDFASRHGEDGTTDRAWVVEWMEEYFSDTDGDGDLDLPRGDTYKLEYSVSDMAGNRYSSTGWYRVEERPFTGSWRVNGNSWGELQSPIKSNDVTFKFLATSGAGSVRRAKVEIYRKEGGIIKSISLNRSDTDTWKATTTLSDGKYMVRGSVNGDLIAQTSFNVKEENVDYGNYLAYGFVVAGLLCLLGGFGGFEKVWRKQD